MSDTWPLDFADLDFLATKIAEAGVPATRDPSKFRPDGAFLSLVSIDTDRLSGNVTLKVNVWLVVGRTDGKVTRQQAKLAALFNKVLPVLNKWAAEIEVAVQTVFPVQNQETTNNTLPAIAIPVAIQSITPQPEEA